jgi:hypothetical protein
MYACTKLEETRKMVEIIRSKGYDVYFLDMLPTMKYINKVRLYEIQTKEDFEKKIVTKYYSLNNYKNNEIIADIIKNKIIDKLFLFVHIFNNINFLYRIYL